MISETVTIDVELPDSCSGYRVVGIRVPQLDDYFYDQVSKSVGLCQIAIHEYPKIILEPIKKWRPVDLDDLLKCLTIGSRYCRAWFGGDWHEGALHAGRPIAGGYTYYVQVGNSFNWYTRVEVLDK